MSINRVILMGRLTRDVETRDVGTDPSGKVAKFGLAVNDHYKDQAGKTVENTHFFEVETWGRQAELCAEYIGKGTRIVLEGKLMLDRWESGDGSKRSRVKVRAERVQFLSAPKAATASA